MARLLDGREHLLTLARPLDLTTAAAIAHAVNTALTELGWSDIRMTARTYEVIGTPPVTDTEEADRG